MSLPEHNTIHTSGGGRAPGPAISSDLPATAISSDLASAEAKKDRAHTDQGSRWGPAGALGRRHRKPKGVSLAGPRGPRGGQRQRKARGRGGIAGSSEIFIRLRGGKKSPRRHLVDPPEVNHSCCRRLCLCCARSRASATGFGLAGVGIATADPSQHQGRGGCVPRPAQHASETA